MRAADEDDLDAWMARLADGDRAAFDPIFRALHPRAFRLAAARLPPSSAADVAQAALVKVFTRASEFTRGRPLLPWFYAILANEIRAAMRTGARSETLLEHEAHEPVADDDPELLLVTRELNDALEHAIAALDARSAEAIAALLGRRPLPDVAPDALRKRVSRAYARLRVLLGGYR